MKQRVFLLLWALCLFLPTKADEGMWMIGNLNKGIRQSMRKMGIQLKADKLYNPKGNSLKDCVVSFGGFCSGVVVSENGLVFTNHHCGFHSIQQLSNINEDFVHQGFIAYEQEGELPCPELYVRFLLRQENVTRKILSKVKPEMSEYERANVIDSLSRSISEEISRKDSTLVGIVDAYYSGSEFWLSVYQDFNDIRLVFAPPSYIGKFGWETDNWVWPRHTGDFCVFRIYANAHNRPADYAADNRPYRTKNYARLCLDGYQEGDATMTIGYPGETTRFLSSYGIDEIVNTQNQAQIDIRSIKQDIWKMAIRSNDSISIMYAAKYDESSNYWKNSIGVNEAIRKHKTIEKKQQEEDKLLQYIRNTPAERGKHLQLFSDLKANYRQRFEAQKARFYLYESFLYAPELIQQTLNILNLDLSEDADEQLVNSTLRKIVDTYRNMDTKTDKAVFGAMVSAYKNHVEEDFLPDFYTTIDTLYSGNISTFVDSLYARTHFATQQGLEKVCRSDSTFNLQADPAVNVCLDILAKLFEINALIDEPSREIERLERDFTELKRRYNKNYNFYPDANSTMRLSIGTIKSYSPRDGVEYAHYTTVIGILEKLRDHLGDPDFEISSDFLNLLVKEKDTPLFDKDGTMHVNFITNNDITGGNSGSPVFNAKGELLGLAFDGNWEAMNGDFLFEENTQRCIAVDTRYMLYIMQLAEANRITAELGF
ncbi:MAG: S46 family peptidase [Bacteroidales bacterium]|nr:S46 family peptidase [Bacteroidales bacterium]